MMKNWYRILSGALMLGFVSIVIAVFMNVRPVDASNKMAKSSADSSIETRIQRLEDRESARKLLIDYGRIFDKHDLVEYSKLFAKDGVWQGGVGSVKGPDRILNMLNTMFSKIPPDSYKNSFHIMSSFDIDTSDPGSITTWSRWTYFVDAPNGGPTADRSGHYEDVLEKEDGRWKFKLRNVFTELPTLESRPNDIWQHNYKDPNGK